VFGLFAVMTGLSNYFVEEPETMLEMKILTVKYYYSSFTNLAQYGTSNGYQ
jgi:hypothetical protein